MRAVEWFGKLTWVSISNMAHAIVFFNRRRRFCFAFITLMLKLVIRKFQAEVIGGRLSQIFGFSFDGDRFEEISDSKHSHRFTLGLANYQGMALTTGCDSRNEFQSELLDLHNLQWFDAPDYPFSSENKYIYAYSVAETSSAAYIIGGYNTEEVVAEFKDFQWRRLADLNKGRTEHGSISIGHQTMIIGGYVSTSE